MKTQRRGIILRTMGMILPFVTTAAYVMADGPTISGYVDTQYGYNFDQPSTGQTTLRSYDLQDNTIATTAHIAIMGSFGEGIGYAVDIDAGHDANTTAGGTTATTPPTPLVAPSGVALQEAYLTYASASKWGFKVGKFATYQGIEVIETNANPTITRGYLYGMAEPFTHVGGVVTYALGKLDFAAGVVNGWDQANDNNSGKTVVGKIGLNLGDPLVATLSGYHGPEQAQTYDVATTTTTNEATSTSGFNRNSIDLTILTKIIPKVDLFLQVNYGSEERASVDQTPLDATDPLQLATWSGAGIQPVIHFSDKFSVGARLEYFDDKDGARTATTLRNVSCTNFTVTPGYKVTDNILVRAEYRYDTSNKKIWFDEKGKAQDTASTATAQFLISF